LFGFSNAIGDLMAADTVAADAVPLDASQTKINLVSISKPIWFYGLEEGALRLLPKKEGRVRRGAVGALSLAAEKNISEIPANGEVARLTRALPLWFAETFYFSAGYEPIAALGLWESGDYALMGPEWAAENIRQLNESNERGLDFVVAGFL